MKEKTYKVIIKNDKKNVSKMVATDYKSLKNKLESNSVWNNVIEIKLKG